METKSMEMAIGQPHVHDRHLVPWRNFLVATSLPDKETDILVMTTKYYAIPIRGNLPPPGAVSASWEVRNIQCTLSRFLLRRRVTQDRILIPEYLVQEVYNSDSEPKVSSSLIAPSVSHLPHCRSFDHPRKPFTMVNWKNPEEMETEGSEYFTDSPGKVRLQLSCSCSCIHKGHICAVRYLYLGNLHN